MWIVAIAWMYVALMMTLAEATHPNGSILGAIITFLFYGVGPVAIVMYILSTPARRRARQAAEAAAAAQAAEASAGAPASSAADDARSHAAGDAIAPEREVPPRG